MSYNCRNIESKNNDLHTAISKNTEITIEPEKQADKEIKVVVTGDSLRDCISKKGLSKNHQAKIKHFPGGTTETIVDERENLIAKKSDCLITHVGTNNLTKGVNSLKYVK